jgi:hypothetical protein
MDVAHDGDALFSALALAGLHAGRFTTLPSAEALRTHVATHFDQNKPYFLGSPEFSDTLLAHYATAHHQNPDTLKASGMRAYQDAANWASPLLRMPLYNGVIIRDLAPVIAAASLDTNVWIKPTSSPDPLRRNNPGAHFTLHLVRDDHNQHWMAATPKTTGTHH